MNDETLFLPPRRAGLLIHSGLAVLLLGGSILCLIAALNEQAGTLFVLFLLGSLLLLPPAVFVVYRGYALLQAGYLLERDGLRLRWGLRAEDIPLMDVEWVRPASELGFHLPLPPLSVPGAILGILNVPGLGPVEFMASDRSTLLLVATPRRVFAISPAETKRFTRSFQRSMELGSLSPISSHSSVPAAFLQRVWSDRLARTLVLAGLGLTLVLLILTGVAIPNLPGVSLGYDINARPLEPVPPERLLLLPTLAFMTFAGDVILGLFFYRKEEQRLPGYLLLASGIITSALLTAAVLFILF